MVLELVDDCSDFLGEFWRGGLGFLLGIWGLIRVWVFKLTLLGVYLGCDGLCEVF